MAILSEYHPQVADCFMTTAGRAAHPAATELLDRRFLRHELHPRLEELFSVRFDAEGRVRTVYPEPFSAGLDQRGACRTSMSPESRNCRRAWLITSARCSGGSAGDENYTPRVNDRLAKLSPVQQARAMSVAGSCPRHVARQACRGRLRGRSGLDQVRALDEMVNRLYADAARRITDLRRSGRSHGDPAGQPGRATAGGAHPRRSRPQVRRPRRGDFTEELRGQDFGDRLRQAFLEWNRRR